MDTEEVCTHLNVSIRKSILRCVKACLSFCMCILHSFVVKVTLCGYNTCKAAPICSVPMWVKGQFIGLVSKMAVSVGEDSGQRGSQENYLRDLVRLFTMLFNRELVIN